MKKIYLIILLFFVGCIAEAQVLLQWNTFGNAGTETTEPSVFNDPNISAANLTQGTITAAANGNRFGGSGWFNTGNTAGGNTLAEAVAGNDYIQFIITPNAGFAFTPTSFVFTWDRSGTGPQNVALRSSSDGFTANLGTVTGIVASAFASNTITISGLTNITTATTFRIYGYGSSATAGTGGFDQNAVSPGIVNVQLNGTTAPLCTGTPTGGTSTPAAANVCNGSTTTISATGYTPASVNLTYQWQSSDDLAFTTPVDEGTASATYANFTTPALTATKYYRLKVVCTNGPTTAFSSVSTVTVDPVSVGGTVATAQTICSGTSPADITLSGNTGNVVKWQSSSDAAFTTPVDIANTTATLTGAAIGNLTANTYFRAVVQSGVCASDNSTAVLITVNPAATADAGGNQSICGGNTFTPSGATATNNSGVNWTTSGDGTFTNGNTLTPTYTPGIGDLVAGTVVLTLTATGNSPCANATSNMTLTITTTGVLAGTAGGPQVCQTKTVGIGATYNDGSCNTIATVIPAGPSPVSGSITTCVKVENSVPTYNSIYYVARHYDVEPAVAPSTSSASVTLYFSPSEMAAFNATPGAVATHYPLPVAPGDNTDSVRIEQYHGTGSDPTNYTGALETWSTANGLTIVFSNGYWAITVPATSFSGFWLTAKLRSPLPIKVEYFRGAKQGNSHVLDWKVVPVNTANGTISLERSSDGRSFSSIYSITASSVRMQQPFNYATNNLLKGTNYYRLKLTDDNGVVTYSGIVALLNSSKGFELVNITPNPVTEGRFKLNITAAEQLKMEVVVTDMAGRIVSRQTNNLISGFNAIEVNVNTLANGMYQVMGIIEGERTKTLKFVKK